MTLKEEPSDIRKESCDNNSGSHRALLGQLEYPGAGPFK